eukprot:scaffold271071_cov17-Tisochrysis_lutea.AAC.1
MAIQQKGGMSFLFILMRASSHSENLYSTCTQCAHKGLGAWDPSHSTLILLSFLLLDLSPFSACRASLSLNLMKKFRNAVFKPMRLLPLDWGSFHYLLLLFMHTSVAMLLTSVVLRNWVAL